MVENNDWIKVADGLKDIRFNNNNIALLIIQQTSICLIKTVNGLKACSSKCPHAGGNLSEGFLDSKGNIICPVHDYRFNLTSGRDSNAEGYFLRIYQVIINEEGIFIKLA